MIGGSTYTGRARIYYALYRACEWMADRLRTAEEFFLGRAHIAASGAVARVFAARQVECSHCGFPLSGEPTHDSAGCIHHKVCCHLCHPAPVKK